VRKLTDIHDKTRVSFGLAVEMKKKKKKKKKKMMMMMITYKGRVTDREDGSMEGKELKVFQILNPVSKPGISTKGSYPR
jgi:hypothetical protein